MTRRGRDLEVLVERLEVALADTRLTVKSPDVVVGRHSGVEREIDLSVRGPIGSMHVFAMIECRKRQTPADVTWIEQVKAKRDDVGADRAVAVSARGFSAGARTAAASYGILLRTLAEIENAADLAWLAVDEVEIHNYDVALEDVQITINDDGSGAPLPGDGDAATVQSIRFRERATGRVLSVDDIVRDVDFMSHDVSLTAGGENKKRGRITLSIAPGALDVVGINGGAEVAEIVLVATVTTHATLVPISTRYRYREVNGELHVEGGAAEATIDGVPLAFVVNKVNHHDGTVTLRASVQTTDGQALPRFHGGIEWAIPDSSEPTNEAGRNDGGVIT